MKEAGKKGQKARWDGGRIRSLREHLGMTQQQMADELGTRQQTISEWETGMYLPRGASSRLLNIVAERADFRYGCTRSRKADGRPRRGSEGLRNAGG